MSKACWYSVRAHDVLWSRCVPTKAFWLLHPADADPDRGVTTHDLDLPAAESSLASQRNEFCIAFGYDDPATITGTPELTETAMVASLVGSTWTTVSGTPRSSASWAAQSTANSDAGRSISSGDDSALC
jgi:hypothetical protein